MADLLTMRSGLAANDDLPQLPGNEDKLDAAPDPIAFLCGVPRASPPGSHYAYDSLAAYTVGLVIEAAVREREADFERCTLFDPLGITKFTWASDKFGHTKGQGNLSVTTRDLATIGQMVLDQGRNGNRQVIGAAWIEESLKPRVDISQVDPYADRYGYFWYSKTHTIKGSPVLVHFASGNGGNKIYNIPARQMVVAITSSAYDRDYGQRRSQAILLDILHV